MSSQTRSPTLLDQIKTHARRVDVPAFAAAMAAAAAAAARELWEIVNSAVHLRDDLRRMADECESARPEDAARLRRLADRDWSV